MRGWRQRLLPLLLVIPALLAYRNSFTGVFVFDDRPSIVDNPSVRNDSPWAHPLRAMQAPRNVTLSGRPVACFTFAMNYALAPRGARDVFDPPAPGSSVSPLPFQQNVWAYHATNLAIHLIATLLIFGIVNRSLRSPIIAGLTALLWSVHPLTTSAVTYIVQRVESLMAMFMLLTLYCAIRAWEAPGQQSRRTTTVWMCVSIAACALGMGTKEAMVGAPLIVFAWDWVFVTKPFRELLRERWPLYAGLCATWMLLAYLVSIDARPLSSGFHFPEWPWTTYFLTQTSVILHYVRLAFWPSPLVLDYDVRQVTSLAHVAVAFVLLSMTFVLGSWGFVRRKPWGFAIIAFFVLLAPTSSVLPIVTEVAAEHRMYLPLAVIVTMTIAAVFRLLLTVGGRKQATFALTVIAAVAAAPLATATDARNLAFASDAGIWFDTIQKQPKNARARNNYAADLLRSGQSKAAEEHLQVAVTESPNFAEAHANLGVALANEGRTAEAVAQLERALAINPFYTAAYENLAEAYESQNQMAKAVKYFLKTLDQRPDDIAVLIKTAWILATANDPAARDGKEAVVLAEHAVALTARKDASSLDTLAAAYAEDGRFDDAITTVTAALAVANARGDRAFPAELMQRLALYKSRKPIRM